MREPLKRLESHYDYIHWGPRSRWATFWKGQDRSTPSFDACAARHAAAARAAKADDAARRLRPAAPSQADKGDCLYWANAQLAYFCGVDAACAFDRLRTRDGGQAALRRALANIDRDFAVVGVVEDLAGSFGALETVLPTYFAGMRAAYEAQSTHSRANAATPKRDDTPEDASVDVDAYLRHHVLKWEYSLYDRVYRRFRDQKRACDLAATKPRPKRADV